MSSVSVHFDPEFAPINVDNSEDSILVRVTLQEVETKVVMHNDVVSFEHIVVSLNDPELVVDYIQPKGIRVSFDTVPNTISWNDIQDKPDFSRVAYTGDYNDLLNKPDPPTPPTPPTPTDEYIPLAEKGVAGGVATLDQFAKIPARQLKLKTLNGHSLTGDGNIVIPNWTDADRDYTAQFILNSIGTGWYSAYFNERTLVIVSSGSRFEGNRLVLLSPHPY